MALLAILVTLVACNSATPEPAQPQQQPQAAAVSTEEVGVLGGQTAPAAPATQEAVAQPTTAAPAAEPPAVEGTTPTTETLVSEAEKVSEVAAASVPVGHYGLVVGRIDDKGFNQLAWEGMQRAADDFGVKVHFLSDRNTSTIGKRINQLVNLGYDGIVTVGFDMADETKKASLANPDLPFAIVDFPGQTDNDLGLLYAVDAPAFMAGYLAAGMTQTGTVCTYGGQQIPPVMMFMVGFESGIKYYNAQKGTNVQLLGWQTDPTNPLGGDGAFASSFSDPVFGRVMAQEYAKLGCDIIFPVAGAVGLRTAEVAKELGLTVIGVDADQAESNPEYADVYLSSVRKRVGAGVYLAIKAMHEGTFTGGTNLIGTLENEGVDLSPFHSFEDKVPQQLKDELAQIRQGLIDGTIPTGWPVGVAKAVKITGSGVEPVTEEAQSETAAPAPAEPPAASTGGVTEESMANATYNVEGPASGTATLVNGVYSEPAAPGSASEIVVTLSPLSILGDLNGDGVTDGAAILMVDMGGSGTFYHLAAVVDQNGTPVNVDTVLLGDRVNIQSVAIKSSLITINMVTSGPNDPMCCPSLEVTLTYKLEGDKLMEQTDFNGTYTASMPSASSPGIEVTLTVNPDGTVQMSSDYLNGEPPIVQTGTWVNNNDGSMTVTLTDKDGQAVPNPEIITFRLVNDQLIATVYDVNTYGSAGLTLTKQ
jgi:basic membrane protein A